MGTFNYGTSSGQSTPKYQGPVRPTDDEEHFRNTGETKSKSSGSDKKFDKYYDDYISRGYSPSDAKKKAKSKAYDTDDYKDSADKALRERLRAQRENAQNIYNSGLGQIENLINVLDEQFNAGRGRLDTQKTRGFEEFDQEKGEDMARLKAFYARMGTADSEQNAQALERMQNQYSKRFQGLEENYGNSFADLEAQKAARLAELQNKQTSIGDIYRNSLRDIDAQRWQGEAAIEQQVAQLMQQLQDYSLKERALQLDELRTQHQISRPSGGSGGSSGGFTPIQQYNIMSDYQKDMQDMLAREAWSGQQGGRERVLDQLSGKYGNILDPASIQEDLFGTYAQNGWENLYQSMYPNPQDFNSVMAQRFGLY